METDSLRLLLIEDDLVDACLIEEYLTQSREVPIELERADRLATGLDHLSNGRYDCAVVDLNLPDSVGLATLAAVHGHSPRVPIVVLTGMSPQEFGLEAVKAGADDYISKDDLEPKLLVRTIRYAVERAGHRQTRQQNKDARTRYRVLFEQSPDGVLLIDPRTLRAVEFNDAACGHLGYTREEFGCLRISDYEALETAEEVQGHWESVLRGGRDEFETKHRTKTGDIRNVLVAAQALTLAGRLLLHCVFRDITEQKRAEEALRASEQHYRQLLEAVTTYTYSVTFRRGAPVATQHSWGCVATTGYSPAEYAAAPYLWIHMVHPDDREMVRQYVAGVANGEKTGPIEHRIHRKDGQMRWIRNTMIQYCDQAGELAGYDGLVEDVTERKEAERALRQRETHLLAAQAIQQRLRPEAPPDVPGFDIAGASWPAEFAAGDYFDYLPMADRSIAFVIGDVSGHGLGPAIVTALAFAHLRCLAQVYDNLDEMVARLNGFLAEETDHFVTLLVGRLTPADRSFAAVNAGHPPGYVLDASGGVKARFGSTTLPLAILPEVAVVPCEPTTLDPGDVVLLFTDGIPEARSARGDFFGKERLLEVARTKRAGPAAEIVQAVYESVRAFCRPERPRDDMTLIAIKVEPER